MPHALIFYSNRQPRSAARTAIGLVAVACALVGCSTMGVENSAIWSSAKREAPHAVRMTIAWSQGVEKQPGKAPVRGFRARVRFFDTDEKKGGTQQTVQKAPPASIKVDGTLTVFAFDETLSAKWGTAGSRKFVVAPAEMKKQRVDTALGPHYNLWLPWDKVGGAPLQIRLLVRFDPAKSGPVLISENSRHRLPSVPSENSPGTLIGRQSPPPGADQGAVEPARNETPAEVQGRPAPVASTPVDPARN
jgi:hypothetical protein